ncbi:MAG: hypothetical protein GVY13_09770 [Alphaproteobacteria bacterium]|jgi:hypothetical protein|nr:hypothetical protein [Alphaproteobacteria bacterium]
MATAQFSDANTDSVVENLNSTFIEVLFSRVVPWSTRDNPRPNEGYFLSYEIQLDGTASAADVGDLSDTVLLPSGAKRTLLEVGIVDDLLLEIDEDFGIRLTNSNFADLSPDGVSIRIVDNDGGGSSNDEQELSHQNFEVHRFFNSESGRHFYTASKDEGEFVLNNIDSFVLEEASSFFSASPVEFGASPVFRFFNEDTGVHFYTINEDEKDFVIQNNDQFVFEGTGFHAWDTEIAPTNSSEVHRFFNPGTGSHFFATSEEAAFVQENLPQFQYEGVAFHVFEQAGQAGYWGDLSVSDVEISGVNPDGTLDMSVSIDRTGNMAIPVNGNVTGTVTFLSATDSVIGEIGFELQVDEDSLDGSVVTMFDGVVPLGLIASVKISAYSEFSEPYTSFDNQFTETIPGFSIFL